MAPPVPFSRQAGTGPTVLCLHSNASHSGQWRGLLDQLADGFQVVAVDSYGSGKTPDWPSSRTIELADEVQLIAPLLEAASRPAFLVGHSYGAAVAVKAALMHPRRFGALVLYEPTLFGLVDASDAAGIITAVNAAGACLDRADTDGAGRCFIDFWMGPGNWDRMPADRKPAMAQSITNVRRWAHALTTEALTAADLAALKMPVLLMTGSRSPRSSLSVARMLMKALPRVERVDLAARGHMAPVTHPDEVNAEIERFLRRFAQTPAATPST
jgi:pimeloyl-ACP methyl ester carboxylesterase